MLDVRSQKIWVAGHSGLVGSALVRAFVSCGIKPMTVPRSELDLCSQTAVAEWMKRERPDVVILAAAKVGGIGANSEAPAEFIQQNLAIANNVIHHAYLNKVRKLVFLGSSCIYPKFADQPIREDSLLTGALEPTNEAYAIAKIAGLKMCQAYRAQYGCDFISVMPCNLYGINDRWANPGAHVIPALIERFHRAKLQNLPQVAIWGTGTPLREFLFSDDVATAIMVALEKYSDAVPLNIGSGQEITILQLARLIAKVTEFDGDIITDPQKPDGTPRKVLDSSRLRALGWRPQTTLEAGLRIAYHDYLVYQQMHQAA